VPALEPMIVIVNVVQKQTSATFAVHRMSVSFHTSSALVCLQHWSCISWLYAQCMLAYSTLTC